jgi:hypothetical protein
MAPPNARGFFHKLAHDDKFRERVRNRDTMRSELKKHGLELTEEQIPQQINLPSKQEMQTAIDELSSETVFEKSVEEQKAAIIQKVMPAIPLVAAGDGGNGSG